MPGDHQIGSKSRDVGWYDEPITSIDPSVREILEKYSNYDPSEVVSSAVEMVGDPSHTAKRQMDNLSNLQS